MNNTAGRQPKNRAEREAEQRSQRRAEQAGIVSALMTVLESDEQLLGFARGRIAGGFRGKLNVGPEAFFAPGVNIGLSERRLVLQHIHSENGRPSEILPHYYALSDIASLTFSDIETYGADPACRLVVRMTNEATCRLRLRGQLNFESAATIAEVFNSLTGSRRNSSTPTQRSCSKCVRMLDQPYKFCPYCGHEAEISRPDLEPLNDASEGTLRSETPQDVDAAPETVAVYPGNALAVDEVVSGDSSETGSPNSSLESDDEPSRTEAVPPEDPMEEFRLGAVSDEGTGPALDVGSEESEAVTETVTYTATTETQPGSGGDAELIASDVNEAEEVQIRHHGDGTSQGEV